MGKSWSDKLRFIGQKFSGYIFILSVILVLLSRLPFLSAGYGIDPDAWRVAKAARKIALTGEYSPSRFPGYPIQEIISSWFWEGGPRALNGATALFSVLGFIFFALILKKMGSRDFLAAAIALFLTPVIYLNSAVSMDYVWALTFILGALYFILQDMPLAAGMFMGLAAGSRLTSLAMILPLANLLAKGERRKAAGSIFLFLGVSVLVGMLCYLPVYSRYGMQFLSFVEGQYPSLSYILLISGIEIWTLPGCLVLALALFSRIIFTPRETSIPETVGKREIFSFALAVLLETVIFLRLPYEAGYLIPALPFVFLLLARFLDRRIFLIFCTAIMVFSLAFTVGRSGLQKGAIWRNNALRKSDMAYVEKISKRALDLSGKNIVVSGAWVNYLEVLVPWERRDSLNYTRNIDNAMVKKFTEEGFRIYYLPEEKNSLEMSLNPDSLGLKPLLQ
ncbi:MAG: hypothetical protein V1794_11965 [Candidatus Glassbacteria bacterium]